MLFWHGNDSEVHGLTRAEFVKGYPLLTPNNFFVCLFCFGFCYCEQKKGIGQEHKKVHSSRKTTGNLLMYILSDPSLCLCFFLQKQNQTLSSTFPTYYIDSVNRKLKHDYPVPGPVLGTGDTLVNKTNPLPFTEQTVQKAFCSEHPVICIDPLMEEHF